MFLKLSGWLVPALLLTAASASAQQPARPPAAPDSVAGLSLPDSVARAVADFYNDPAHLRFDGPTTIGAADTLHADVAVLGGPLVLGGRVDGRVVVVNGDARLLPGASITGALTVVGGVVEGADSARIEGGVTSYVGQLHYRRRGYEIEPVRGWAAQPGRIPLARGRSDFLITTGGSYNRVEGLPITFGPRIRTGGSNPFVLHAFAIYRTESGLSLDPDEMGYYLSLEQFLGGHQAVRIGASLQRRIDPIESWHVNDLENGLSTFLFHRDFRDHYEHRGGSVFASWQPRTSPLALTARASWEKESGVEVGNPWSLFGNSDEWRLQPLIAEGHLSTVGGDLVYDTRNDRSDPSTGWLLKARVEQALSGILTTPFVSTLPPGSDSIRLEEPLQRFRHFGSVFLDLRRYNRLDPRSRLDFRVVAGLPLNGALPPQRQFTLGGVGSLPGYGLFSRDCGARDQTVYGDGAHFLRYGCDAVALVQAQYRGKLAFHLRWDALPWRDDEPGSLGWDLSPDWVLFADAGRGWRMDGPDTETAVDVGAGIAVERLGLYLAVPLRGEGGIRIFARLGPRF